MCYKQKKMSAVPGLCRLWIYLVSESSQFVAIHMNGMGSVKIDWLHYGKLSWCVLGGAIRTCWTAWQLISVCSIWVFTIGLCMIACPFQSLLLQSVLLISHPLLFVGERLLLSCQKDLIGRRLALCWRTMIAHPFFVLLPNDLLYRWVQLSWDHWWTRVWARRPLLLGNKRTNWSLLSAGIYTVAHLTLLLGDWTLLSGNKSNTSYANLLIQIIDTNSPYVWYIFGSSTCQLIVQYYTQSKEQ